jgi:DNA-binding transcriptional LysR family regulator
MRVDLLSLKLFVAIFEEQSIARAAEREHIAPSALSKRLSDLEESFGLALFHRTRSGLDPTPAAHAMLQHAQRVLRDVTLLESELADHSTGLKGTVRICANVWAIVEYLPADLAVFLASHPRVRVEIEEGVSSAIVQAVTTDGAEIGVVAEHDHAPGLTVVPYRRDRLVAVMPAAHPLAEQSGVTFAQMLDFQLIGGRRGSAVDELARRAASAAGRTRQGRINVSGFEAVCRMAEAGIGIGLVPWGCAERYRRVERIAVVPLLEPWAERALKLCYAGHGQLSPAARQLVRHLAAQGNEAGADIADLAVREARVANDDAKTRHN